MRWNMDMMHFQPNYQMIFLNYYLNWETKLELTLLQVLKAKTIFVNCWKTIVETKMK